MLFNQQHFKARSKTIVQAVSNFFFAHDCALLVHTIQDMQWIVNNFSRASKAFGLTITLKKRNLANGLSVTIPQLLVPPFMLVERF